MLGVSALGVLLLAVALAASGSAPRGSAGTRGTPDQALDLVVSLVLVLMALGTLFVAYMILMRRATFVELVAARRRRSRWVSFAAIAIGFGLFAVFLRLLSADGGQGRGLADRLFNRGGEGRADAPPPPNTYEPEFATGPVLVVLGLLALIAAAWFLSERARRRRLPSEQGSPLPALADVLDETLDDLRAEQDPRRAVVAAYARMEQALAAFGLPRRPAEAPAEYLKRIFEELDVGRRATSHLTRLFSQAKFSSHDVDAEMKGQAIEALVAIRDELRTAALVAEQERVRAVTELRERAAR